MFDVALQAMTLTPMNALQASTRLAVAMEASGGSALAQTVMTSWMKENPDKKIDDALAYVKSQGLL